MFAVQRFALTDSLAVKTSTEQRAVSSSLASSWVSGEVDVLSRATTAYQWFVADSRPLSRRRLQWLGVDVNTTHDANCSEESGATAIEESGSGSRDYSSGSGEVAWEVESGVTGATVFRRRCNGSAVSARGPYFTPQCASLVNRCIVALLALVSMCLIQLIVVCLWKHRMNRAFYRQVQTVVPLPNVREEKAKTATFYPFPKSLAWPTPLIFVGCACVTGLSNSAVTLVLQSQGGHGVGCTAAAWSTLGFIALFLGLLALDLTLFRCFRRKRGLRWKTGDLVLTPGEVNDPTMRLSARARELLRSVKRRLSRPSACSKRRVVPQPRRRVDHVTPPPSPSDLNTEMHEKEMASLLFQAKDSSVLVIQTLYRQRKARREVATRRARLAIQLAARRWKARQLASQASNHERGREQSGERVIANSAMNTGGEKAAAVFPLRHSQVHGHSDRDDLVSAIVARDFLKKNGYRDRKQGSFVGSPANDIIEPARTERLLKHPFALYRSRTGDKMQVHDGFLLFRVNGSNCVGLYYRLIVVVANVIFGFLGGIGTVLADHPLSALLQVASVLLLQLALAFLCCCFVPDADRVISSSSGTQFVIEAASSGLLFLADVAAQMRERALERATDAAPFSVDEETELAIRTLAFWFALLAIVVPMLQLLEQRLITPMIMLARTKKANTTALLASAYILASSLPRLIESLFSKAASRDAMISGSSTQRTMSADGAEGDVQMQESGTVALSCDDAYFVADKATKLLARGLAGKESAAKQTSLTATQSGEHNQHGTRRSGMADDAFRRHDVRGGDSDRRHSALSRQQEESNARMLDQIKDENEPDAVGD